MRRSTLFRTSATLSGAALLPFIGVAHAAEMDSGSLPPALRVLQKQGVHVVSDKLPAPPGMKGWAGYHGQQPMAFYTTADGKSVIIGTMIDAKARDLTRAPLEKAVAPALSDGLWGQLSKSTWIVDGNPKAKKIVYVFTDPNCPYCSRLWGDLRPWVDAGKVQIRNIIVGILTPTSYAKAAALLASKDPVAALHSHEEAQF